MLQKVVGACESLIVCDEDHFAERLHELHDKLALLGALTGGLSEEHSGCMLKTLKSIMSFAVGKSLCEGGLSLISDAMSTSVYLNALVKDETYDKDIHILEAAVEVGTAKVSLSEALKAPVGEACLQSCKNLQRKLRQLQQQFETLEHQHPCSGAVDDLVTDSMAMVDKCKTACLSFSEADLQSKMDQAYTFVLEALPPVPRGWRTTMVANDFGKLLEHAEKGLLKIPGEEVVGYTVDVSQACLFCDFAVGGGP